MNVVATPGRSNRITGRQRNEKQIGKCHTTPLQTNGVQLTTGWPINFTPLRLFPHFIRLKTKLDVRRTIMNGNTGRLFYLTFPGPSGGTRTFPRKFDIKIDKLILFTLGWWLLNQPIESRPHLNDERCNLICIANERRSNNKTSLSLRQAFHSLHLISLHLTSFAF